MKIGYTVEEAAAALGVGRTVMYELLDGQIESVKVGRRRIVPVDALTAFMDKLRAEQKAAA